MAKTVPKEVKKIVAEAVYRHRVPESIESNRGVHFKGEVMQEMMKF